MKYSLLLTLCFLVVSAGVLRGQNVTLCLSFPNYGTTPSQIVNVTWQKQALAFQIKKDTCLALPPPRGTTFSLLIECAGYLPFRLTGATDSLEAHPRVSVLFSEKIIQLDDVVIKPEPRVRFQGDTLIMQTQGIDTRPHSDASELMQNMPGVNLSDNGRLTVMGKSVNYITVDGKLMFGGNVKATLEALKSDMIEQLELVKSSGGTGSSGTSLNLKLKGNRTKGWYTDLATGYAPPNRGTVGAKANRIDPGYFLNGFINHNSLNESPVSAQDLTSLHTANYARSTRGAYSVLESAEPAVTKMPNIRFYRLPAIDTDEGRNKLTSAGANFTKSTKVLNLNAYLFLTQRQQNLLRQQSTFRRLEATVQQVEAVQTNQNKEEQIYTALDGTYRPNERESLKFTHTSSLGKQQHFRNERNQIIQSDGPGTDTTTLDQRLDEYERPYMLANSLTWTHRYIKPAKVLSLYVNQFSEWTTIDQNYQNQYVSESVNRTIDRKIQSNFIQLQGIQSLPLTKKWLLEARVDWVNDDSRTRQAAFRSAAGLSNVPVPTQTLPRYQTVDNSLSTTLSAYFKARKLTVTGGITAWKGNLSRSVAQPEATDANPLAWLPKLYATYHLGTRITMYARYSHQIGLPSAEQLFPLPDSSNVQAIRQGNRTLFNYFAKTLNVGLDYSTRGGKVLTLNFTKGIEVNSIIPVSIFEKNGLLRSSYVQTDLQLPNYTLSVFLINLPSDKKYSYFLTAYLNERISYVQSGTTLQAFRNQVVLATADLTWTIKTGSSIAAAGKVQLVRQVLLDTQVPSLNTRSELALRGKHRFGPRLYGDFSTLHILNKNNQGDVSHYPFADLNLDYYALKNQGLRVSLTLKNAFNTNRQVTAYSTANQISQSYTSNLPRFLLVKLTAYLQKWQGDEK